MDESPFSKSLPTLQTVWDQTSMSEFQVCPRKYKLSILDGWVPAKEPIEFFFGRVYHKALEDYDKALATEHSWEEATDAALNTALVESVGWDSQDRIRNRENLIRAVVWYAIKWKDYAIKPAVLNGKPAVELSFRLQFPMRAITGEDYILAGHLDGLATQPGEEELLVRERKTTKSGLSEEGYFSGFNPGLQITWYGYGVQTILRHPARQILLDAAQLGVGFTDYAQTILSRKQYYYDEFIRDLKENFSRAERYAEEDYWPKNERQCWICPFRKVCASPPDLRESALKADFARRYWNPLETRG